MASILTPEDVVRRIAAECTFIDERCAVGIRQNPAATIVRQYGEQFRRPVRRKRNRRPKHRRCCDRRRAVMGARQKRPVWSGICGVLCRLAPTRGTGHLPLPEYFDSRLGLGAGAHRATTALAGVASASSGEALRSADGGPDQR
jgi:hypothetical protein